MKRWLPARASVANPALRGRSFRAYLQVEQLPEGCYLATCASILALLPRDSPSRRPLKSPATSPCLLSLSRSCSPSCSVRDGTAVGISLPRCGIRHRVSAPPATAVFDDKPAIDRHRVGRSKLMNAGCRPLAAEHALGVSHSPTAGCAPVRRPVPRWPPPCRERPGPATSSQD